MEGLAESTTKPAATVTAASTCAVARRPYLSAIVVAAIVAATVAVDPAAEKYTGHDCANWNTRRMVRSACDRNGGVRSHGKLRSVAPEQMVGDAAGTGDGFVVESVLEFRR